LLERPSAKYDIVDVDAHYLENVRDFAEYLEEPDRTTFRNWSGEYHLPVPSGVYNDTHLGGRIKRTAEKMGANFGGITAPEHVKETMEWLGIDAIVLIPTYMLTLGVLSDRDRAVAICKAFVDYMLDGRSDAEKGIYFPIVVPLQDPEAGAKLIDEYADRPEVCAVMANAGTFQPPLGSVTYNPIYEAAQRHGLPVICHAGNLGPDFSQFQRGFQSFLENHALDLVFCNEVQVTSVILEGVFERYPNLQFIFQESGVAYIPALMHRLDTEYMRRRTDAPVLKRLPSDYVREHLYFATQPFETSLKPKHAEYLFDMLGGPDRLMYASDWPHWDWDHPDVISELPFLTEDGKQKILGGNARKILRMHSPVAAEVAR
jgi:predicted TIM-barrel fold metal-dependent hydrolase